MRLEVSLVVVGAVLIDGRLLAQRHDHHLRPGAREPEEVPARRLRARSSTGRINETLPRSVLTHGTTLVDPAGAGDLRRRGDPARSRWSCSSACSPARSRPIFIASPVLLWIEQKWPGAGGPWREGQRWRPRAGLVAPRSTRLTVLVDTHCHLGDSGLSMPTGTQVLQRAWASWRRHIVVDRRVAARPQRRHSRWRGCRPAALGHRRDPSPRRRRTGHPSRPPGWPATLRRPAGGRRRRDGPRLPLRLFAARRTARGVRGAAGAGADAAQPVIIHAREADDDVAAVLRSDARTPAVLHSFSQRPGALAGRARPGPLCLLQRHDDLPELALDDAVRAVPLERLLVETDGPYLAPVPQRGKRNEPAFVRHTAERLAAVLGIDAAELIDATDAQRGDTSSGHDCGEVELVITSQPISRSRSSPEASAPHRRRGRRDRAWPPTRSCPTAGQGEDHAGGDRDAEADGPAGPGHRHQPHARRRGEEHRHDRRGSGTPAARQEGRRVHPRAVARTGVRREGRRGGRRLRPGRSRWTRSTCTSRATSTPSRRRTTCCPRCSTTTSITGTRSGSTRAGSPGRARST